MMRKVGGVLSLRCWIGRVCEALHRFYLNGGQPLNNAGELIVVS